MLSTSIIPSELHIFSGNQSIAILNRDSSRELTFEFYLMTVTNSLTKPMEITFVNGNFPGPPAAPNQQHFQRIVVGASFHFQPPN